MAISGPSFVTVMTYVTASPGFGAGSETVFVTTRSTVGTANDAESLSLVRSMSVSMTPPMAAVLVTVVPTALAPIIAVMVSVAVAPLASPPTLHDDPAKLPCVAEMPVTTSSGGTLSATKIPAAASGPLFVTVTV
ncbi:hypothetical protein BMS3Bbin02_01196 [bacterium BMS3Bbin02]|nr:hypothetical protein BMS3Bbin02_01196 [bacterium BMS3Bbin02]